MKKKFENQVTITRDQLNQAAFDNGYDAVLCDDSVSEAVLFLNAQSFNGCDIAKLIVDGANGKQVRKDLYEDIIGALNYFEAHKLEINDMLVYMEQVPTEIDGIDKNDPLCFGAANKIRMAQWQFETAMAIIAQWFEDDLEDYLEY